MRWEGNQRRGILWETVGLKTLKLKNITLSGTSTSVPSGFVREKTIELRLRKRVHHEGSYYMLC